MPCNQPSPASKKSLKVSNPSRIYYITSSFKDDTIIAYNIYKLKHFALRHYDSNCDYRKNCYNWPDISQECAASNVFIYPSLTLALNLNNNITYTFPVNLCLKVPVWEFISTDDWKTCTPDEVWWWGWWWGWWWWEWTYVPCRSIALYYNGFFYLGKSTALEQCFPDWMNSICKWSETDIYGNINYFDASCWYAFVFGTIIYSLPDFVPRILNMCDYYITSTFSIIIFKMCATYNSRPTICPYPLNMKSFCSSAYVTCGAPIAGASWANTGCPHEATSNSFYWIKNVWGYNGYLGYPNCLAGQLEVWY
jgi:hypothetical protein